MAESTGFTDRLDERCEESRITAIFFFPEAMEDIIAFTEMENYWKQAVWGEGQELAFGWVKFEILGRYLTDMLR